MVEDNGEEPSLAQGMMEAMETASPLFEAAKGIKQDLVNDGWAPEAAEELAKEYMVGFIRQMWKNAGES